MVSVVREPQWGSTSQPRVAQRTLGHNAIQRARTPTGFNTAFRAASGGVQHRADVQPLRGWCAGFAIGPGVRCATPGSFVGLLRSPLIQHPRGNGMRRTRTPTGLNITARGRAAHPGSQRHRSPPNPNGVQYGISSGIRRGSTSRGCATPSGLVCWFCDWTRGALRDPGLCCWTASQSVYSAPPGKWYASYENPKGVEHHSPGSRSAPRVTTPSIAPEPQRGSIRHFERHPEGFNIARMCNPFGVGVLVLRLDPGCAARPRALLLDCFAVR
jgi:hypothetical protein